MATPPYISSDELSNIDPATGKPYEVVPLEPVDAQAPNRGNTARANSTDYLAVLQRAFQSMAFGSSPNLTYTHATRTLTLTSDLVLSYTVEDPNSGTPIVRTTTLRQGNYAFGAGTLLVLPLGVSASVTAQSDGTVAPASAGELKFFATDGELQQFLRTVANGTSRQKALTYFVFGRRLGSSLQLFTGHVLRDGVTLEGAVRDGEYAGDQLRSDLSKLINQDRNLFLLGGGQISFVVSGANRRIASSDSTFRVVTADGAVTYLPGLQVGYTLTATNNVLALEIFRDGPLTRVASVTSLASVLSSEDDLLILGIWDVASDTFHWAEGSVYRSGDQHPLGVCCELTASFLIERILTEQVYPSDVAADAGVPASSDRVALVVDGADREVIRLVTRNSLDASVTPASEILRAKGVRISQIQALTGVVSVRDVGDTAYMGLVAAYVGVDQVRARTGSTINLRDSTGASPADVIGNTFSAAATGYVSAPEYRGSGGAGLNEMVVRDLAGADTAIVDTLSVRLESLRARGASPDLVNFTGSTVNVINGLAPGDGNLVAEKLWALSFLRIDGSGLGRPEVRVAGSGLDIKSIDGASWQNVFANEATVTELQFFDNILFGIWGVLKPTADGIFELQDSTLVPSATMLTLGTARLDTLRAQSGDIIQVRDSANTDYRDLRARRAQVQYVDVGPTAALSFATMSWGAGGVSFLLPTGASGVPVAASRYVFTDPSAVPETHIRRVSASLYALEDFSVPGSYRDLQVGNIYASNLPTVVTTAKVHLYYSAGWVLDGATGVSSVGEVLLDTNVPANPIIGTPENALSVVLDTNLTFAAFQDWPAEAIEVSASWWAGAPPEPVHVVKRFNPASPGLCFLQFWSKDGSTLLTNTGGQNIRQLDIWITIHA